MPFFSQAGTFHRRTTTTDNTYISTTQGSETTFRYVFLLTVCRNDMTLTPRTGGSFGNPPSGPTGEIGNVTLLETGSAGGFTVQLWERVGVDAFGSLNVYYVFDYSRPLTQESAGTKPTDYTMLLYSSFNGCVAHYHTSINAFTGGPPKSTNAIAEVTGSGWNVDTAIMGHVDESSTDTSSLPTFTAPMTGGAAVGFTSSSTGDVSGMVGNLNDLDAPIGPYTMAEVGSTWAHGSLVLLAGIDVVGTPAVTPAGGWHLGGLALGRVSAPALRSGADCDDFERADGALGSAWATVPFLWQEASRPLVIVSGAAETAMSADDGFPGYWASYYLTDQGSDQVIEATVSRLWQSTPATAGSGHYTMLLANVSTADQSLRMLEVVTDVNFPGGSNVLVDIVHFEADGNSSSSSPSVDVSVPALIGSIRVRFEVDADGTCRVYVDDALVLTWLDPGPLSGTLCGVGTSSGDHFGADLGTQFVPSVRFDEVCFGRAKPTAGGWSVG